MTFILSDETINRFGFRVLTSGIDLSGYKKNPVILFNHNGNMMSVGKMTNLRVEDKKLLGDPEWDEADELGLKLKNKYEKGYMNGFSISFDPVTLSDAPEDILPGQSLMTVKTSELLEISAATIPANKNAVRLSEGKEIPQIKKIKMRKVLTKLGLAEDATEDQAIEKIEELENNQGSEELDALKAENTELKAKLAAAAQKELEAKQQELATELSNPKKNFTEVLKIQIEKIAKTDVDTALSLAKAQPEVVTLHTVPNSDTDDKKWYEGKTFTELQKTNSKKLAELKANDWDAFAAIYNVEFGKDPVK